MLIKPNPLLQLDLFKHQPINAITRQMELGQVYIVKWWEHKFVVEYNPHRCHHTKKIFKRQSRGIMTYLEAVRFKNFLDEFDKGVVKAAQIRRRMKLEAGLDGMAG